MTERTRLSVEVIRTAKPPAAGERQIFDTLVPELALRVMASGAKRLIVRKRVAGGPKNAVMVTILTVPKDGEFDLAGARNTARAVVSMCEDGKNPNETAVARVRPATGQRRIVGAGVTLREAWANYQEFLTQQGSSAATFAAYRSHVEGLLADWLDTPLKTLAADRQLVRDRHAQIKEDHGPYRANACMRTLRAVYNDARKLALYLPIDNPTGAVVWAKETRRNTALAPDDLPEWFDQLALIPNPIRREFHLFTLLSGCRPAALRVAKVEHLDWKRRVLHIPEPKGGAEKAYDIPLSRPMIRCLIRAMRASRSLFRRHAQTWIFAGKKGHLASQQEDKKKDLSHYGNDLRQSYRSLTEHIDRPVTHYQLKLLLNHQTKDVTDGYGDRATMDEPLARAQEALSRFIFARSGRGQDGWPFLPARGSVREVVERSRLARLAA